jgi:hypothetical protein
MTKEIIIGWARHGLTAGAGWLFAQGYITQSGEEKIIALGIAGVGLAWSAGNKWFHRNQLAAAAPDKP